MARKIRKKRKEGSYKKCFEYLKENKVYFCIIAALFLISILIGVIFPLFFQEFIKKLIENLAEKTKGMGFFQLFIFILENNIMTAFLGLLFGLILGLLPLLLAMFNGYVLGFVSGKVAGVEGLGVLFRLLPHGIFEIPALVISLGLGLKLGMFLFSRNPGKQLVYDLENSLRVFLFVIIPLLLIAGFIEAGLIILLG
jgi:stage II sporulation protein M